ncbi:MAG: hypothetical protein WCV99_15010 [Sterolibacterium sp.]|jgi:hypothetical protein
MTRRPATPTAYPVEVVFPDLGDYVEGNGGIPYVYSFASGVPPR